MDDRFGNSHFVWKLFLWNVMGGGHNKWFSNTFGIDVEEEGLNVSFGFKRPNLRPTGGDSRR